MNMHLVCSKMHCVILSEFIVDLPPRIRKPSKRLQEIDPLAPITPARPKPTRRQQPAPTTPVCPTGHPHVTFASRQIQSSQNRLAAAVLFTPHGNNRSGHQAPQNQPLSSPTPHRSAQQPATGSGSDVEDGIRAEMRRLELGLSSSSDSGAPRAGPHSKEKNLSRPRGGAKDVWSFFEKGFGRHTCILCK